MQLTAERATGLLYFCRSSIVYVMKLLRLWVVLSVIGTTFSCQRQLTTAVQPTPKPRNVILMIGDGMGLAQLSTGLYFGDQPSNFFRFNQIALHQNYATDAKITDSAAGATAFSSGYKTYNGAVGVDPDTVAHQTILEWAASRGLSTGIVCTSSLTDATPASFYAHVAQRYMEEEIAAQLADAPLDFFAGGGTDFFVRRKDGANYLDTLRQRGFSIDTTQLSPMAARRKGYILAPDGMPKMSEGRADFLARATDMALEQLQTNPKGFFLLLEGSQIDWAGHANDGAWLVDEQKDFDKLLGQVLDFAARDGNTLVVVTADHETGGLSLSSGTAFGKANYDQIVLTFSTGGHSASLIPVFAQGPGAERFSGIFQNTAIFHKIKQLLE